MDGRAGRLGKKGITPEIRFFNRVKKTDSCWFWEGQKINSGYGLFSKGGKAITAHRFSYEFHKGKIIGKFDVCHKCDNKLCVNPDHLFLDTHEGNLQDMKKKGRSATGEKNGTKTHPEIVKHGEKHPGAKASNEIVIEIRKVYEAKQGISILKIARMFGLGESTVRHIVKRETWKHIQ